MRLIINIQAMNEKDGYCADALAEDATNSGVVLLTGLPAPVGTLIALKIAGSLAAIGEIVDLQPSCHELVKMVVRFIGKKNYWLK
jgi:hypothetical protein